MSGTPRTIRLTAQRAARWQVHSPLTIGLSGLLLLQSVNAQPGTWDCRAGADGQGWQCGQDGRPAGVAPVPPAGPVPGVTSPPLSGPPITAPPTPVQTPGIPPESPAATPAPAPPAAPERPPLPEPARLEPPGPADTGAPPRRPTSPLSVPAVVDAGPTQTRPGADPLDAGIDWAACQLLAADAAPADIQLDTEVEGDLPVQAVADAAVAEIGSDQAILSGAVELVQGDTRVQADEVEFNRNTSEVKARGNFLLTRPDVRVAGDAASYQLNSRQGEVQRARYRIPAARARGEAEQAELLGAGRSQYRDISYTTCRPGDDAWLLRARALELDQNEGFGTARHATLSFMGVPFLYAPWFTFPTDDRRRSGLLVPSVGQSSNTGFDLTVPYYFNLAENYDLTVKPRYMSKRGAMLGGEFRFLTGNSEGVVTTDYLPNDREYGDSRGSASVIALTRFNPRTTGNLRLNYASDSDYLADLGGNLAVTSTTHLERTGQIRYAGDTWDLLGRVQEYQTIDEAIPTRNRPYSRLPQLRVDLLDPDGFAGTNYILDAEYVNFHRSDSVRGHRVQVFPRLSLPLRETWGYVEPQVGAHYSAYQLTDQAAGLDDAPSSLVGVFSLDSGLFFDRSANYFGTAATQTLEPRLYYLYVPRVDQDEQPIFDTGVFDFNFDNLFRENRFNGFDRFGDANQVTLALTSRLIADASGAELLRASVGQILYFEDREVTLPGQTTQDDSSSAFVGELGAALGGGWQARAGAQWNPRGDDNGSFDQALAQITYRDRERRTFNAAYRLRDGVTEQTDLAFVWPVNETLSLIGRHNHSLRDDRLLEGLVGVEYGRCCWRFRVLVSKYADGTGDDHNLGFLVQLELNGLGRLGDNIDEALGRSIYGYRTNYQ